jgi:hypothetical protein
LNDELPSPYIVYLYGHMFARESKFGHKHLVSGRRLNPVELRKNIKLALLVDLYLSGVVKFEIVETRGLLGKRKDLVVQAAKDINRSSNYLIEEEFLALLREKGKIALKFSLNKTTGLEDKFWMDSFAERINKELAEKGYLTKVNNHFTPIMEKVSSLREGAEVIKQRINNFQTKNPGLAKIIYESL